MPRPSRVPRRLAPLAVLAAALVGALALAGCAASTTTTASGPLAASSPTPTDTPTSGGLVAAGSFNGWNGVPALAGTLIYSDAARASDGVNSSMTSESLGLCTPGTTPATVTSVYVTRLPANGWATIAASPQGAGDAFQSCSAGACWKRDAGNHTTAYVALDAVRAAAGATLYTLTRLDVTTN